MTEQTLPVPSTHALAVVMRDCLSYGEPEGLAAQHKSALRNRCSQMHWVEGDPLQALKTWMSWRQLALFLAGTVLCTVNWVVYRHVDATLVRGVLPQLTTVGFVMASIDGGTLWLRRVRHVNPDAFLPWASMPKEERR